MKILLSFIIGYCLVAFLIYLILIFSSKFRWTYREKETGELKTVRVKDAPTMEIIPFCLFWIMNIPTILINLYIQRGE